MSEEKNTSESPVTTSKLPFSISPVDVDSLVAEFKSSAAIINGLIELLDQGNAIPFIARFRRDEIGGLNETQIREIKKSVSRIRVLTERKSFVLKAIEAQGQLSDQISEQVRAAQTARELESIYHPFKTKKVSRATTARQQGLEPLAEEILNANSNDIDIATRATNFVRVDRGLNSVDDVIQGVCDLLIDRYCGDTALVDSLRKVFRKTAQVTSKGIETASASNVQHDDPTPIKNSTARMSQASSDAPKPSVHLSEVAEAEIPQADVAQSEVPQKEVTQTEVAQTEVDQTEVDQTEVAQTEVADTEVAQAEVAQAEVDQTEVVDTEVAQAEVAQAEVDDAAQDVEGMSSEPVATGDPLLTGNAQAEMSIVSEASVVVDAAAPPSAALPTAIATTPTTTTTESGPSEPVPAADPKKKKKKKKKSKTVDDPFKDYTDFQLPINQLRNYQVLAINRGEKSGKLKIKIQADDQQLAAEAFKCLVPQDHPFQGFLEKCAKEALNKSLIPMIERELKRELTENAEKHATDVFAHNLRNLLLQPPMRDVRVLAIDPGFKRGCAVAVIDQRGNLLHQGEVTVVGNQVRRDESRQRLSGWIREFNIDVVAIGSGAACRQAEQLVSDCIQEFLADHPVKYVMVNEAGASIYSTSEIGREEFPELTPAIRSAISIGRRLQDPLSELVKISPANLGVGMYQHDVKAKHLSETLDEVVQSCVNQVGVNVNTASVSLLKHVAGLNSLTAKRLVEHRQKINGFSNRQQFREVAGIGETTFVQAAGFLRIFEGENPLDSTSIHPESYPVALSVIQQIESNLDELFPHPTQTSGEPIENAGHGPLSSARAAASVSVEEPTPTEPTPTEPTPIEPTPTELALSVPVSSEVEVADLAEVSSSLARRSISEDQRNVRANAIKKLADLQISQLASDNSVGHLLVRDILQTLRRPDWDPRDRIARPIFRRGIIKIDDLKPEMQLDGQVVNVVDFGVFVDIGLGDSSLVHVSRLAHHYIADPHRRFAIGDILKVWVEGIDSQRRRIKLTAIQPGSKPEGKRSSKRQSRNSQRSTPGGATSSQDRSNTSTNQTSDSRSRYDKKPEKPGRFGRSGGNQDNRNRHQQRGSGGNQRGSKKFVYRSKPSQVAPPITDGMLEGKEPMRSFSDLMQFVTKKPDAKDSSNQ